MQGPDLVTIQLHWFLPTYGDNRLIVGGGHGLHVGAAHSDRYASTDYLASIVRAAETFGFTGALIATGAWCEDAFVTAAQLARETTTLGFFVAFRPGLVSPTLSAQMAATFARHAPGRSCSTASSAARRTNSARSATIWTRRPVRPLRPVPRRRGQALRGRDRWRASTST
jgi:hypothetical protein